MRLYKRNALLQALTGGLTHQANSTPAHSGYFGGSHPSQSDIIDALAFATEATSILSNKLSAPRSHMAGISAPTMGYFAGGWLPYNTYLNRIDALEFSTKVTRMLASTLSAANSRPSPNVQSLLAGYLAGGDASGATLSKIEKLTFSSETPSVLAATLSYGRYYVSGVSSSTFGYVSGGPQGSRMDKINFATDASSQGAASLAPGNTGGGAGVYSVTKGYLFGQASNAVSTVNFSTDTCATIGVSAGSATQLTGGAQSTTKGYVPVSDMTPGKVNTVLFSTDSLSITSASLSKGGYCSTGISS